MKLPVFKAVGATWAYMGRHALDLLKALWLPALILMAVTVWAMPQYLGAAMELTSIVETTEDPEVLLPIMGKLFGAIGLLLLVYIVVGPMMTTGALRHLIRGETLRLPFRLAFGADELRVIGTYLALGVMFFGIYLGGVLVVALTAAGLSMVNETAAPIAGAVLGVALFVLLIWLILRWSLVFPAGYDSRSLGIGQSWSTTKGAVWSLLFFWIVVGITFLPVALVLQGIAMGGFWSAYFQMLPELVAAGGDPDASMDMQRQLMELQAALFNPASPGFWVYVVLTYVYTLIATAFGTVAAGVAFRFLSGRAAAES